MTEDDADAIRERIRGLEAMKARLDQMLVCKCGNKRMISIRTPKAATIMPCLKCHPETVSH
jgi:hypothetical protein